MFCRKCGTKNEDGAKFCEKCGTPLMPPPVVLGATGTQNNGVVRSERSKRKSGKKTRGIWILYVVLILILFSGLVTGILLAQKKMKAKEYSSKLESAKKYIEELDYEKAETEYLALIEIDPKQEEPYLKLADIYAEQNEPEKAKEILKQGVGATNSEAIEKKYSYYEYVDEYLLEEIGKSPTGTYELSYKKMGEYSGSVVVPAEGVSGLVNYRIMDFDQDGEDEILTLMIETEDRDNNGYESNYLYLRMYENIDGKFRKSAEYCPDGTVLGSSDGESNGVFLHRYGEKLYICGGLLCHAYMQADGYFFVSFVLDYDGQEFQFYVKENYAGSSFWENLENAEKMANKLESINLPKAAAYVEETAMTCMTYEDDVFAVLFRVEGDNVGGDRFGGWENPYERDLGKVVLQYWIDTVWPEEENLTKMTQKEKDALEKEIDALVVETSSVEGETMMEMRQCAGGFSTKWEIMMDKVYDAVSVTLPLEKKKARDYNNE